MQLKDRASPTGIAEYQRFIFSTSLIPGYARLQRSDVNYAVILSTVLMHYQQQAIPLSKIRTTWHHHF
jgi:hypothetical protein